MKRWYPRVFFAFCMGALLFVASTSSATPRKLPPKGPVTVEVGHTIHGISRFPQYHFVLVGSSVPFRPVFLTKEGQKLPIMKYGGMLFAAPKKAWKKHFAGRKRAAMLTAKHLKAHYFPHYPNSVHSQLVLRPGSPVTLVTVKLVVKKIRKDARRIVLQIKTSMRDANGKLIKPRRPRRKPQKR